ncbi:MAG: 16S rRNA (cytidine(1402)-2'-O)-methyltransferase [Anaerolineae bacterium]
MGILYVVATPIGNLEDMTFRAVRILREVAVIAAEDTRTTRRLLTHFDIHTPLTSYHEYTEPAKIERLLDRLNEGDMALVSDAGMPGISDPGAPLIAAAIRRGLRVVPVPGASALLSALAVAGLPTDAFTYLGFLPRRPSDRRRAIEDAAALPHTLVWFETPHRLRDALADLHVLLGDRPIAVARELTKLYEEVWRGSLGEAVAHFTAVAPRGEFTLIVGGAVQIASVWDEAAVRVALDAALAEGKRGREAARDVAARAGWSTREVYALLVNKT